MRVLTRAELELAERERLSPDATFASDSLGRRVPEEPDALRTCFQCDRDRILHSKSFRRLAHKTQVFLAPEGDHYRTRLIHTLEVSQVARSIARPLGLNEDLTEAIALGHDLGHTPFGHVGERALSHALARHRGEPEGAGRLFAHNDQGARIVDLLERNGRGLNLSREVVDGIRCHTGPRRAGTLEGRVVALADRIAYVCHDIDDAERAGMLRESDLPAESCERLGSSSSERIETMVHDVVSMSSRSGDILMSEGVWGAMMSLRAFLFERLYSRGDAKWEEPKAYAMLVDLFEYFAAHPDEVPAEYRLHDDPLDVQVADFVSGMTDRYAIRVYERLKIPRSWRRR
ncbi:deoxyguanosinetriphosphate triphosphohydrolase [Thermophilibacter provencensis]|uniref:Deoxyguanosinetriphosphate triphosphohydrolase n=1 Tax=Thermophilibacter provencensis TaxID=1852386 RepID=A0A921KLY4_9ACTN|nr:deoxyguanosinetriphosphate triphosphohydrolase [Thermophilibacter provencensis]HJF45850.1 deoxyguanosinetriphosphate triphosphohydrolase [Thermophilibacter provencensis]